MNGSHAANKKVPAPFANHPLEAVRFADHPLNPIRTIEQLNNFLGSAVVAQAQSRKANTEPRRAELPNDNIQAIKQVVASGSFTAQAWVPSELGIKNRSGYYDLWDGSLNRSLSNILLRQDFPPTPPETARKLVEQGIDELVQARSLTAPVVAHRGKYKTVFEYHTNPTTNEKEEVRKLVPVEERLGEQAQKFGTFQPDSPYADEDTVAIAYQAFARQQPLTEKPSDNLGRPVASIRYVHVLPRSLAEAILPRIEDDPTLLRKLLDIAMVKKLGGQREVWEEMRMPYDKWYNRRGGDVKLRMIKSVDKEEGKKIIDLPVKAE